MDISGTIRANCPPATLVATLGDVRVLSRLLPEGAQVEKTGEGQFSFTVSKSFGPIRLTLPGVMTITQDQGQDRKLSIRAAHVLGGKVEIDLALKIAELEQGTRLSYSGAMEATGLAGRIAREQRGRVNTVVKNGMLRLKHMAEAQGREAG